MIENKKILVTGGTGHVARPIAESLAKNNEVWCAARFSNPAVKREIERLGIKTFSWTLGADEFRGLPEDFNHVIHAACNIFSVITDYDACITANAEGTGVLMAHCKSVESLLFVSSLIVYKLPDNPEQLCQERTWPLGFHPVNLESYSLGKVATEAVVRAASRMLKIPTTIARLGEAVCGTAGHGGVPSMLFKSMLAGEPIYRPSRKVYNSIIHQDDIVAQVEPLLRVASIPSTIVNWCADEIVAENDVYAYIERISGIKANLVTDDVKGYSPYAAGDPTTRRAITGPNKVQWKQAILRSLRANFPDHRFVNAD